MTREELLSKSTFFDCSDSETLSHSTIEDAVEYYIDAFLTPQMTPEETEAEIRRLSPISVDCYARNEWTAIKRSWYTDAVKDYLFDLFDEDEYFSNPDYAVNETMKPENRHKIVAKADELVSVFSEIAVPWGCNCIGTILLWEDEAVAMMRRENPGWFE